MTSKRTRGPNKKTPWTRPSGVGAVLRLAIDVHDPIQRSLLEKMFSAGFAVRRAVQRDARNRAMAFHAARVERDERGADAVRERLGLSLESLERAAYAHLDGAPHLRRFTTKALAMHLADTVWPPLKRHLFRDASGKRQGLLHVSRWFDFARLPGRARSQTTTNKWETFRLHGTLAGHRAAYSDASGRFFQPRVMRPVARPNKSWWTHEGPLVIVFSGLGAGELVLPVRLPAAPSNQPALDHYLLDPSRWHKVDLVRRSDPNAIGGWRYEAHLMVLAAPYASPATQARRERAARETERRTVGIDVNVSNVTFASQANGADLRITRIARDAGEIAATKRRAKRERRRARRLERSRRASNPDQYTLSTKQEANGQKRVARGLRPTKVIPKGPRKARANGVPFQAYRKDALSERYRKERAAQAEEAAAAARWKKDLARMLAGQLTLKHGFKAVIEKCNLTAWSRLWGRGMSALSPGTLVAAFEHEALAVARQACAAGGLLRASTATTALSQRCLCGNRVAKSLAERVHRCPKCGLTADRDAMSAVLATVVRLGNPVDPSSALVDIDRSRELLTPDTRSTLAETVFFEARGRQDAPSESTAPSASHGSSVGETGRTSLRVAAVARRNAGMAPRTTPDETGSSNRTKPERTRTRTSLAHGGKPVPPLRDSS